MYDIRQTNAVTPANMTAGKLINNEAVISVDLENTFQA